MKKFFVVSLAGFGALSLLAVAAGASAVGMKVWHDRGGCRVLSRDIKVDFCTSCGGQDSALSREAKSYAKAAREVREELRRIETSAAPAPGTPALADARMDVRGKLEEMLKTLEAAEAAAKEAATETHAAHSAPRSGSVTIPPPPVPALAPVAPAEPAPRKAGEADF